MQTMAGTKRTKTERPLLGNALVSTQLHLYLTALYAYPLRPYTKVNGLTDDDINSALDVLSE